MRKLAKDRVYDMLERTSKVEAEKTELSAQKVELSDVKTLKMAMGEANGVAGDLSQSLKKVQQISKQLLAVIRDYEDYVEDMQEAVFAGIGENLKDFQVNAKRMGIDPMDIPVYKEAQGELKRYKRIYQVYSMKARDMNEALSVLRKL